MTTTSSRTGIRGMVGNNRGQGLVEYALILVLIAVVVIVAMEKLGQTTSNAMSSVSSSLTPP